MLNYIWGTLMLTAIIASAFTGRLQQVSAAAMSGAGEAVTMTIALLGIMCLWTGLMRIASESGLINFFTKLLKPLTKLLFPTLSQNSPAMDAIVMNMTANLFGMSNAATPLGLKAMKELVKLEHSKTASDNICMFIVINTASLQIVPTTILAIRQAANSANSFEIILPVWIASACAITVGVITTKFFARRDKINA